MNGKTVWAGYATAALDYGSGAANMSSFMSVADMPRDRMDAQDWVKRAIDVTGALVGVVALSPLWALIALAVKLTSKGPVIFSQERAGLHGRPFRMFKFRSMVADAEERLRDLVNIEDLQEPVYKLKDDPRVTPVGRFLRRFGLDELPQLLNVLRGEMSFVGPRPEVMALVNRYTLEQRRRLRVKPGITGYQQIHNRGMPDMAARLVYDRFYLRHRSTGLDLWILAMTAYVIASGKEITY
jgi:lipopolysaccharide/colanic/teichoic acid biosynthesis glycosyltransferase